MNMKSKTYLAIVTSILTFALITTTIGTTLSIFENVIAHQEGANNSAVEDSVNDTQIDTDAGNTRSSPDFSALNDTATTLDDTVSE
jgi:hypothetical protein